MKVTYSPVFSQRGSNDLEAAIKYFVNIFQVETNAQCQRPIVLIMRTQDIVTNA